MSDTPVIALSVTLGLAICVIIFMMIIVIRATRHQSQHRSAAVRKYAVDPSTAQHPRLIPSDELVANEAYGITPAVPEQLYAEASENRNATNAPLDITGAQSSPFKTGAAKNPSYAYLNMVPLGGAEGSLGEHDASTVAMRHTYEALHQNNSSSGVTSHAYGTVADLL